MVSFTSQMTRQYKTSNRMDVILRSVSTIAISEDIELSIMSLKEGISN